MEEIWKIWKENILVSNFGNVKGRKIIDGNRGYLYIVYKQKKYPVHQLVAELFIPNLDNKPQLDHIDRNKNNNNVTNLRWVTHTENNQNKVDIRRIRGVRCKETGVEYQTISSIPDYSKYKSSYNHMKECIENGWSIRGFHYEYILK